MRIQCPECEARYEVPDDRLQPGRTVRCARCGCDWSPVPAEPVSDPAGAFPVAVPDPAAGDLAVPVPQLAPVLSRPPRPFVVPPHIEADMPARKGSLAGTRPTGLLVAWGLTVLVLAAAAGAAIVFRGPIVSAWPPSQRAYDALGLTIPGPAAPADARPSPPGH